MSSLHNGPEERPRGGGDPLHWWVAVAVLIVLIAILAVVRLSKPCGCGPVIVVPQSGEVVVEIDD